MTKNLKRVLSLVLAMIMLFSSAFVIGAFAEESSPWGTVKYIDKIYIKIDANGDVKLKTAYGDQHCYVSSKYSSKVVGGSFFDATIEADDGYEFSKKLEVVYSNGIIKGYIEHDSQEATLTGVYMNSYITKGFYRLFPKFMLRLNLVFHGLDAAALSGLYLLFGGGILD